jgi:hypothetical protein
MKNACENKPTLSASNLSPSPHEYLFILSKAKDPLLLHPTLLLFFYVIPAGDLLLLFPPRP